MRRALSRSAARLAMALGLLQAFGLSAAHAQQAGDFPSRPVKLQVGYSAGGPTDVLARLLAQDMAQSLGQPVIVENRVGVNGNIATEYVAHAPADGYTLIVNAMSHNVNPLVLPARSRYDPDRDFAPVSLVAVLPQLLVVPASSPYRTVADLVAKARTAPDAVSFSSSGIGSSGNLSAALLAYKSGTRMVHVPFKGNADAITEVMSGRVDFTFFPMVGVSDFVSAGRVRVLAVNTAQRHPDFPGVPTMAEAGYPGFEDYMVPIGVIAPAGTPRPVLDKLDRAVTSALAKPATQARFKELGAVTMHLGPDAYREWLAQDRARLGQLIRSAGIRVE